MKVAVYNQKGEKTGDLTLSELFDVKLTSKAVTLYINYLRSALRNPVANSKDRSEVSGGGRKPWRQKGTGNARVGSTRSPLWVGGGVTFGPSSDQNFKKRINAREKKRVILGIIGEAANDKKLMVIDKITLDKPKSKDAAEILDNLKVEGKASVILNKEEANAMLSFRNLSGVEVMHANRLKPIQILSSDKVILTQDALKDIEEIFNPNKKSEEK